MLEGWLVFSRVLLFVLLHFLFCTEDAVYIGTHGLEFFVIILEITVSIVLGVLLNLELSRRGGKVNIGKYGSTEVDFVTQKEGVLTYYQVTADMTAEETFERDETAAEHSG